MDSLCCVFYVVHSEARLYRPQFCRCQSSSNSCAQGSTFGAITFEVDRTWVRKNKIMSELSGSCFHSCQSASELTDLKGHNFAGRNVAGWPRPTIRSILRLVLSAFWCPTRSGKSARCNGCTGGLVGEILQPTQSALFVASGLIWRSTVPAGT